MRVLIATLLLVPLSGCLGGTGIIDSGLFDYIQVERGDPTPIALDDCDTLLETLNLRAEQRALVDLHQSYENQFREYRRGGVVAVEESADDAESSAGQGAADNAHGASSDGAEATGTNNQEQGVDEADIIKTDGEWTYVLEQGYLHVLRSETVGGLVHVSATDLADRDDEGRSHYYYYGYGGQLLLVDRGNADASDDRIVVIRSGVNSPVQESQKSNGENSDSIVAEDSYYYGGNGFTHISVYSLADKTNPVKIQEHYIEGDNAGARLVNGVAHVVVHQYEPRLDLIRYVYPDDQLLKEEGMTWSDYDEASSTRQKQILEKSVRRAIEHNTETIEGLTLDDHLPTIYRTTSSGVTEVPYTASMCQQVLTTMDDMGRSVSTILSFDADNENIPSKTVQILGGRPIVYGAQDALVLASSAQEHWWFWAQPELEEATNLHWFDLDGLGVSHRASGRVIGIVQDQFGIDVHNDQLRVATTTGTWGRWWIDEPTPMMNHLFVFEALPQLNDAGISVTALVPVGSVTGFAAEERIWSARFTDDRAYIVTFRQIDPLWIIDLSEPTAPKILGELEIPGVSTYIHPLPGEEYLLTIGLGPRGQDNEGLDWSRVQVSLFDIRDTSNPVRADVYDVTLPQDDDENSWSWGGSTAVHEHKAFTYWDKLGMLSVPVSWNKETRSCTSNSCTYTWEFHTGLELINVDKAAGSLSKHGSVDQDHMMTAQEANDGYYWGSEVQRSHFLGFPDEYPDRPVSVYAMSNIGVSAHDLATLQDQDSVRFNDATQPTPDECVEQPVLCEASKSVIGMDFA